MPHPYQASMIEETDTQESLNPDSEVETEKPTEESETSTDEVNAELKKAKEYAQNQKIRAEKAEQELKALKKTPKEEKETPTEFSPKDYLALSQAGVPADDLDEVMDFAKYKGISIHEALKSTYIKTTLKEKAEERKSAEATSVGASRKPSSKATGEALLEKLEKNELPIGDIEAAVRARIEQRQNKT